MFFPNSPKEDRSKFLVRVDDKPQYAHLQTFKIDNREGNYIEKYDIVSKYQRREGLELISAAQFTNMYEPSWKKTKDKKEDLYPIKTDANKFHFVMTRDDTLQGEYLPETITLSCPFPDEPPFMRKRKVPVALRYHKVNANTDTKK